ncbi:hypothetical protein K470DRAFT_260264 [Piedraia hortae CBS 480.64]|uniref:Hydrophobin n=1 Tax=Piedraia hortae CBS 480.64 TaxID=1314780 RepID=A0A6A7BSD5_9PEZI|nr:hypothetical protein K470DRAFT_260264 [Piedraia hortae CBS 480.64]
MRPIQPLLLLLGTGVFAIDFQPFFSALPIGLSDYIPNNNTHEELLRRQNSGGSSGCPTGFGSCENLGAPGLCCANQAVCSADQSGHVACCPTGVACSGAINGVITAGTMSNGQLVGAGAGAGAPSTASGQQTQQTTQQSAQPTSDSGNGLVSASSSGGFIVDGQSTVASLGIGSHALRRAEVPAVATLILRVAGMLPRWLY